MTVRRREVLSSLGVASASSLLWALGCGGPAQTIRRAPQVSGEVRTWLHDAVARLAAIHPTVHALAVSRRSTAAARDVLGAGGARLRSDGAVLTIRDRGGAWREHVTSDLTAGGVAAAAAALGATDRRARVDFGPAPTVPAEPPRLDDGDLRHRVDHLLTADARVAPHIVYGAALLEHDDAVLWSVAPGRDLEQRLTRIRQTVTRAAWSGTRPVVRELARGWTGALDDAGSGGLTDDEILGVSAAVLEQLTPGAFDDGERPVVLDPSVAALLLDAVTRALVTAVRRPDALRHAPIGAALASPAVTLIDDPTVPDAYGHFDFDDEGVPATPLVLLDAGHLVARLTSAAERDGDRSSAPGAAVRDPAGRGRRAGHLAAVSPSPSHLRLVPGDASAAELYDDGFLLEGGLDAALDPASDRLRLTCARARELKSGSPTGRIYPDVELVGSLTAILSSIDAVARDAIMFAPRGPDAICVSIAAPALRTRGLLRATRSRA